MLPEPPERLPERPERFSERPERFWRERGDALEGRGPRAVYAGAMSRARRACPYRGGVPSTFPAVLLREPWRPHGIQGDTHTAQTLYRRLAKDSALRIV